MKYYLQHNIIYPHTHIVIMDNDINVIDNNEDIIKKYNKFYSTNEELIYNININNYINSNTNIYEPFYGNGDLLKMLISTNNDYKTLTINDITDIDDKQIGYKNVNILNTDSLLSCLWANTEHNFIITNPPYTSKNKLSSEIKNKYKKLFVNGVDDLYLIFMKQLINYPVDGGFIIIPSNFIFGKRNKLFIEFMKIYNINILNIYEKKTFENTTQSVISLLFTIKKANDTHTKIYIHNNDNSITTLSNKTFNKIINYNINDWLPINDNNIIISRSFNKPTELMHTHIRISLLDYNMKAYYTDTLIIDKETDHAFMSVCINKNLTEEEQYKIIELFNEILNDLRNKTHSLIFTSYREFNRKRLSFSEAIHILKYTINKLYIKQ